MYLYSKMKLQEQMIKYKKKKKKIKTKCIPSNLLIQWLNSLVKHGG